MIVDATFIGTDGSLGYRKNRRYRLEVKANNGFLFNPSYQIMIISSLGQCPYKNIETFLANWTAIRDGYDTYYNVHPKGKAKHYRKWSRKGHCPGCGVGCGSDHREHCPTREELLKQI